MERQQWHADRVTMGHRATVRDGLGRPLRRDARANQERVLAAAVTAIGRAGPHVAMSSIAAEAGVGVGTLYRRYPNREALLDALTVRSFELLLAVFLAAEGRRNTALSSLGWWWDEVIDHRHQLILPLGGGRADLSHEALAVRSDLHDGLRRLLERGQREGSIRDDVTITDLILFGAMLVSPSPGASDWTRIARRQKDIYLDGLAQTRRARLDH